MALKWQNLNLLRFYSQKLSFKVFKKKLFFSRVKEKILLKRLRNAFVPNYFMSQIIIIRVVTVNLNNNIGIPLILDIYDRS